jgi:hypothetical protein
MSKFTACTMESGTTYRICEKTGETRAHQSANMFGGASSHTQEQVRVWEMLHPDDAATEKVQSPYGAGERPVGVGRFLGEEWL